MPHNLIVMVKPLPSEIVTHVAAGPFGSWLSQARASLRGNGGAEVACGDCIGCCTSSLFIHIRPEDSQTLAKVPAKLLVRAPGWPRGHMVMGFSKDGACLMLNESKCSIYQQRPRTCRDYDCRIFAAAGIDAGGKDKTIINKRVREWLFTYPAESDEFAHNAVRSAASFIQKQSASFPGGRVPMAPSDIAVLAIKVYAVFLDAGIQARSKVEIANAIIDANREFDKGLDA
jgi:Fe-S-cluster containining protein